MKKRSIFRVICLFVAVIISLSAIPVQASDEAIVESDTFESDVCESFDDIADIIFGDDGDTNAPGNGTAQPLWGGSGHESTVATKYGTAITTFMKNISTMPDNTSCTLSASISGTNYLNLTSSSSITLSNGSTFKPSDSYNFRDKAILHGRGNYVESLRFLYTVARNLVNNEYSGTRIQVLQSAIKASLGSNDIANNTFYGENKTYCNAKLTWTSDSSYSFPYIKSIGPASGSTFTSLQQRLSLEKAIFVICYTSITGQQDAFDAAVSKYSNVTSDMGFKVKSALKIIGIATHLCGDIYAHKTVVPLNVTFANTVTPSTRDNKTIYRGTNGKVDAIKGFNGKGKWSAKNGIKTLITSKSTITTQQITQW